MGESPQYLVSKYGNYGHGGSTGEHRLVLGSELVNDIEADTNIRVLIGGSYFKISLEHFKMNVKQRPHFISPFC